MLKKILILAFSGAFALSALASDQVRICARYYRPAYGTWSKTYKLTGYLLSGVELAQAVGGAGYDAGGRYVVISWKGRDHTVIRVPGSWDGREVVERQDQKERPWRIRTGWSDCSRPAEPAPGR